MAAKTQTTYAQSVMPTWYTNYAQGVLQQQAGAATQPYQAYQGPRLAGFNDNQNQGFNMATGSAMSHQPGMQAGMDATQGALQRSAMGAASPSFGQAQGALGTAGNLTMQSTDPTGLNMAQPYLNAAGQSSVSNVGAYMDPYINNVVNRYGELGARTLSEQLMPAITSKFISAGQLAGSPRDGSNTPSGLMTDSARALRDVQEGVGQQQMQALSQGYQSAVSNAQTDLARQAQLAATAGQLGQNQQNIVGNAGQQMGALGSQYGQLGGQIAQTYNTDTQNQLAGGAQLSQQAGALQDANLQGASAVLGVGNQQQAQQQANLDIAYQNFLQQQGYPQAQIDAMVKTMGGLSGAVPVGQVQSASTKAPSASTLSQLAGAGLTLAGSGVFN